MVHSVDEDIFRRLCQDEEIDDDCRDTLRSWLNEIAQEIAATEKQKKIGGRDRTGQLDVLAKLVKSLNQCDRLLRTDTGTSRLLRRALRVSLGENLDIHGLAKLFPEDSLPTAPTGRQLLTREATSRSGDVDRSWSRPITDDFLRTHADEAMRRLLSQLRREVELAWKALKSAPVPRGNIPRQIALSYLANIYQKVQSREPAASKGGPFVRFCEGSLAAIGIDTAGLESAIDRLLS